MKKKIVLAATTVALTLGTLLSAAASASTGSSDAAQSASSSLSSAASQAAGFSIFDDAPTVMIGIGIVLMLVAAIVTLKNRKR